jgi:hypothetical protein
MTMIIDNQMLWRQFGAAIDELGNALRDCPDECWNRQFWDDQPGQWVAAGFSTFWYLGYHTLFWLDLYLNGAEEGFAPPEPFDLVEMEAGESLPRMYSRSELLGYWEFCRNRCKEVMDVLTDEQASRICRFPWGELPYGELLVYNLRHAQEHTAQLRMFLGQQAGKPAKWVTRAKE